MKICSSHHFEKVSKCDLQTWVQIPLILQRQSIFICANSVRNCMFNDNKTPYLWMFSPGDLAYIFLYQLKGNFCKRGWSFETDYKFIDISGIGSKSLIRYSHSRYPGVKNANCVPGFSWRQTIVTFRLRRKAENVDRRHTFCVAYWSVTCQSTTHRAVTVDTKGYRVLNTKT